MMALRLASSCLVSIIAAAPACAPTRGATHASAAASAGPSSPSLPQTVPAPATPREVERWELHVAQSLGIDAPFERAELLVSSRAPTPRVRLLLTERPASTGTKRPVEINDPELCFERVVDGATTTFHVRTDTPAGALDWRFEWPERGAQPANAAAPLRFTIGLYQEPSKPIAAGAAAR